MLLFQLAAAADTLLVRQVPLARTGLEQFVFVVSGLTSLMALVLVVVAIVLLLSLRSKAEETRGKLDELLAELRPLTKSANAMVQDASLVARNVNEVVERSRDTVKYADARVRKSVTALTDRVDDLSDLLGRVNVAAERVETVATTTVAGIKFGARALGFSKKGKRRKKGATPAKKVPAERPRLRRQD